ncbi:MAG: flagella basal body P-ring formation protein FlgA [Proteobacteria bacterium]|nr:flagella basal body P-ring formation protein FlgA [Pseudomonadota bacterium]
MIRLIATAAAVAAATPAIAQSFQSTTLIDKAVAGFTGRGIGEDGGARTAVDARLKLAACPMVTMNWRTPAHDSVVVACPDPEWRIYVPIRIAAPSIVAPSPLAPPPPAAAKPSIVIKRGDPVSVVAGTEGFSVTRDGVAVNDAAAGQRVLIKIQDGKPPIQAIAIEPGKAMIPGGE